MTFAARTLQGATGFVPVTHIRGPGSGVETIPVGATKLVIELGEAGAGGGSNPFSAPSGGGSGGLIRTAVIPLTSTNWGQTLNWSLAFGALGGAPGSNDGAAPAASSVSNGTFVATTVNLTASAPTGGKSIGFPGGLGGAVSGGAVNTPGNAGQTGNAGGNGGARIVGTYVNSGAGGAGNEGVPGGNGENGAAAFAYT